jgi:hypothetical protein
MNDFSHTRTAHRVLAKLRLQATRRLIRGGICETAQKVLFVELRFKKQGIVLLLEDVFDLFLNGHEHRLVVGGLLKCLAQLLLQVLAQVGHLILDKTRRVGLFEDLLDSLTIVEFLVAVEAAANEIQSQQVVGVVVLFEELTEQFTAGVVVTQGVHVDFLLLVCS